MNLIAQSDPRNDKLDEAVDLYYSTFHNSHRLEAFKLVCAGLATGGLRPPVALKPLDTFGAYGAEGAKGLSLAPAAFGGRRSLQL